MPRSTDDDFRVARELLERLADGEVAIQLRDGLLLPDLRTNSSEPSQTSPRQGLAKGEMTATMGRCQMVVDQQALLCGSFAPLHRGHQAMQQVAQGLLRITVHYELTVVNADKPVCSVSELGKRLAQFGPHDTVWVTRLPTFHEKAAALQPRWFVVGTDTMRRIADLRFYDGQFTKLEAAIEQWQASDTRFLVFGRSEANAFLELEQLNLPESLRSLCEGVTESEFRHDVSSTRLREAGEW